MAQENGFVNEHQEAVLEIVLDNGNSIECVLDTGFNGSLLLPRKFVEENSMKFVGRETAELVDEITIEIESVLGKIKWFAKEIPIRLFVSETSESLIGTELLTDSVLEIDYINRTVKITKPN